MDNSYDYWYGGHEHLGFYPKEKHKIFKNAKSNTQVEILEEGMLDFLNPNLVMFNCVVVTFFVK